MVRIFWRQLDIKSLCSFPPHRTSVFALPEEISINEILKEFKYLGHMITDNLTDDADIQREVHNLFVRTNILRRRFYKCSMAVKCVLFKTYCICLYDAVLWSIYNKGSLRKLSSCYNKRVKLFFLGSSVLTVLQEYWWKQPCQVFNTLMHNSHIIFSNVGTPAVCMII